VTLWSALVAIVAIIAFASVRIAAMNRRHGIGPVNGAQIDDGDKLALQREVENLRERIKVLERITTEANASHALESRRVADEIESLRDR